MKIGSGQTKRTATPSVAYAIAKATWNAADPATRGPHPVDAAAVRNGGSSTSRSPWRTQKALPRVIVPVGER